MPPLELLLYSRPGCHLCDEMKAVLAPVAREFGARLQEVDISADAGLEAEYGYDRWDAYMMLSQCGQVRLGNFVDPKYTVGAGISKKYLELA